jgi:hypothetical protein
MDTAPHPEKIGIHLGVPASRDVSEMNAGLKQLAHGESWQCHCAVLFRLYLGGRHSELGTPERPIGEFAPGPRARLWI